MKKFFTIVLFAVVLASSAISEGNISNMTSEELLSIISEARNELTARNAKEEGKAIIVDTKDYVVYLTNNVYIKNDYIHIEAVFVNNTDKSLSIGTDSFVINGWEAFNWSIGKTSPHSKKKDAFEVKQDDTDISDISEIETIKVDLYAYDMDTYEKYPLGIINVLYDGKAFVVVSGE